MQVSTRPSSSVLQAIRRKRRWWSRKKRRKFSPLLVPRKITTANEHSNHGHQIVDENGLEGNRPHEK